MEQQTTAKWPDLWHFEHLSLSLGRCHLVYAHDCTLSMVEPGDFSWVFLSLILRAGVLAAWGFPFFWCISPRCLVSDWPATWNFTSSDWRAISIAVSSHLQFLWEWFVQNSDNNSVPNLLISLCSEVTMFGQFIQISNEGFHGFSFSLHAAMNNIFLRYEVLVKFLNDLCVYTCFRRPRQMWTLWKHVLPLFLWCK